MLQRPRLLCYGSAHTVCVSAETLAEVEQRVAFVRKCQQREVLVVTLERSGPAESLTILLHGKRDH